MLSFALNRPGFQCKGDRQSAKVDVRRPSVLVNSLSQCSADRQAAEQGHELDEAILNFYAQLVRCTMPSDFLKRHCNGISPVPCEEVVLWKCVDLSNTCSSM